MPPDPLRRPPKIFLATLETFLEGSTNFSLILNIDTWQVWEMSVKQRLASVSCLAKNFQILSSTWLIRNRVTFSGNYAEIAWESFEYFPNCRRLRLRQFCLVFESFSGNFCVIAFKVTRLLILIASPLTGIIKLAITRGIFQDCSKQPMLFLLLKKKISLKKKITGPLALWTLFLRFLNGLVRVRSAYPFLQWNYVKISINL